MRALVDTQSLIWYVDQDHRLTQLAQTTITDRTNDLLFSAASLWEIAIKVGVKKLALSMPFRQWMSKDIADLSLEIVPITLDHADVLVGLPAHHRDPFDRLLIAQALAENAPVVSADPAFDLYQGVRRIW